MVRRVKAYKKGFVTSDSNLPPEATLADVLDLKTRTGHSTVAITADGTPHGKLLGIVASRDYRTHSCTGLFLSSQGSGIFRFLYLFP